MTRPVLTVDRIVETSRELLVQGGPESVVVREVARRLGVTAPALYRHVCGRDDLLTLLISTCNDEVTEVCAAALAACPAGEHELRLRAATRAFRDWSVQHPPEFGLLWGTPIVGYAAPPEGPTAVSGQRFGQLFGGLFADLLRAGRLRTVPDEDFEPHLRADLARAADRMGLPMRPGEVYPFVQGFHRMLGIVSVEVSGHLRWALPDAETFTRRQLDDLAADLLLPATTRAEAPVLRGAQAIDEVPPSG
jgi:AcrR family transcriptional regulator